MKISLFCLKQHNAPLIWKASYQNMNIPQQGDSSFFLHDPIRFILTSAFFSLHTSSFSMRSLSWVIACSSSSTALTVSRWALSAVDAGLSRTMIRSRCVSSPALLPPSSPAAPPRLSAPLLLPSSPFSHSVSFPVSSLMVRWSVKIWSFCCRTVCRSSSAVVRR